MLCKSCFVEKPEEDFPVRRSNKSGRYSYCKTCSSTKAGDYYKSNKEKRLDYLLRNRLKVYESRRSYRKKNSSKILSWNKHYQTRKTKACPIWLSNSQKEEIEYLYWLAKDLRSFSAEDYHVDHIVPLKGKNVCGLHVPWNLQILPAKENSRKSNNHRDEYD